MFACSVLGRTHVLRGILCQRAAMASSSTGAASAAAAAIRIPRKALETTMTSASSRGRKPFWWRQAPEADNAVGDDEMDRACADAAKACELTLYLDDDYIFVHKPADCRLDGNFPGIVTLERMCQVVLRGDEIKGEKPKVRFCHQLDVSIPFV